MKEIEDINNNSYLIKDYIQKYGFMPEHNFEYFKCLTDSGQPMFLYEDDFGVLCFKKSDKIIKSLVEPLANQGNIINALNKFIEYCFDIKKVDELVLETRHDIRRKLISSLKNTKYRILKERYHMMWPVFIMQNFDETLSGGKWKKIRNYKSKFFKENNPEIDDFKQSDKEELKKLVKEWVKKRKCTNHAEYHNYLNFIDNDFKGFNMVKVIRINNKPVSVFGGWRIPNSENYYSSVGIYDYDIYRLGEISNILDLTFIKKLGIKKADFGGGEESLTEFKKKFFPDEFYRTDVYAVKIK